MGLKNILPDSVAQKHLLKEDGKKENKKIDKKSIDAKDLLKRIEIIEKYLGLD